MLVFGRNSTKLQQSAALGEKIARDFARREEGDVFPKRSTSGYAAALGEEKKKKDIDRFNSPFFLCMPIEYFSIYIHTQRGVNYTVYLGMGVFTCLYVTYVPVSNVH